MLNLMSILIIIIALPLCFSHDSPTMRSAIAQRRADNLNYHLTENVFPEHYTLKITPEFNNWTFMGYVKIIIHLKIPTNKITLHQKDLNITKEKIFLTTENDTVINIKDAGDSGTEEQEFYTITFHNILKENTYYLHIPEFSGVINKLDKGFYYAHYFDEDGTKRKFAVTQFESTAARYAFPCFDEPNFRAKFKIYIVRPSNYSSISNTKLVKSLELNNSLYEDEFETTVSMPTYLVAYVVSQMKFSINQDNDFYRIFARKDSINKGHEQYSLKLSPKILQALETYCNVKYSLNKMDQVSIPADYFSAGAMENWGLVTYQEPSFLFHPDYTTIDLHRIIDLTIVHEFAHQWFGNLVTMKSWRYLWLKEGFATFLEGKILDMVKPEWRMTEQFNVIEKQHVLQMDSSIDTRDLNQDAGTPAEIRALYDIIVYEKAYAVIQMLEAIMTPNIFKIGIRNYLQDRAFQSATPADLYRSFQNAVDNSQKKLPEKLSIQDIMTTWDSQKGYPLVTVQRDYDKNQDIVKLTQSRYITYPDVNQTVNATIWYIPINYATKSNPNFNDTQDSDWLKVSNVEITIKNLNRNDWLILNKQDAFYYRVNYDEKNWILISNALLVNYSDIHVLNRAQIIQDSFEMAEMEKLDYSVPFKVCSYLVNDDDFITNSAFLSKMFSIVYIIAGSDIEKQFQDYVMQILKKPYERLGVQPKANDTLVDKLHRIHVVNWMCMFDYPGCRESSMRTFNWRKGSKQSLSLNLQEVTMCNAMRKATNKDWNDLYKMYQSANRDDFKGKVFISLGCTEDVNILKHFLDSSLNSSNNYTIEEVMRLIIKNGIVGSQVSKDYVTAHFARLQSTLGDKTMIKLLTIIISHFTSEAQVDVFLEVLRSKSSTADKMLQLVIKKTGLTVSRNQKRMGQISKFFRRKSGRNVCRTFPNVFPFILYSLTVTILYV